MNLHYIYIFDICPWHHDIVHFHQESKTSQFLFSLRLCIYKLNINYLQKLEWFEFCIFSTTVGKDWKKIRLKMNIFILNTTNKILNFIQRKKKKLKIVSMFFSQSRHKDPSFLQTACDKSHEACVLEGFITLAWPQRLHLSVWLCDNNPTIWLISDPRCSRLNDVS